MSHRTPSSDSRTVRSTWPVLAAAALPLCWLACEHATRAVSRSGSANASVPAQVDPRTRAERLVDPRGLAPARPFEEPASTAEDAPLSALEGRAALERLVVLLDAGIGWLDALPGYSAVLCRQERIDDELRAPEEIRLKIRHEPFSVYMKWIAGDVGRELLFVEGENDDRMLVRLGGWKSRIVPPLWIDPHGERAADKSRYPVTEAGLLAVARQLADDRRNDVLRAEAVKCRLVPGRMWNDRPCWLAEVSFDRPGLCRNYRKSVVYVDRARGVPLHVRNYEWPSTAAVSDRSGATQSSAGPAAAALGACTDEEDLDSLTLVESYDFRDFVPHRSFEPDDFDRDNDEYRLRR